MVVALRRALVVRGAVAVALGLSLIFGSLILGSVGAGSSASAEGPVSVFSGSVFYGYVFADSSDALPERVRALGPAGAVCGSADVAPVAEGAGFYVISVVSDGVKHGCPGENGVVQFSLLSGRLDDDMWAEQVATLEPQEAVRMLNLRAASRYLPNWAGAPGNVAGGSVLRWTGDPTLMVDALAALPFATGAAYRLDPALGFFVKVTPSNAEVLTAGELLLVTFG